MQEKLCRPNCAQFADIVALETDQVTQRPWKQEMSPEATHRLPEQNKTRTITVTRRAFSRLTEQDLRILFNFITQHPGETEFPRYNRILSSQKVPAQQQYCSSPHTMKSFARKIKEFVGRLEIRTQDEVTVRRMLIVPLKGWES